MNKKLSIMATFLLAFSLLSMSAFAQAEPSIPCETAADCPGGQSCDYYNAYEQSFCTLPCSPENVDADCPAEQTCEYYEGPGYACNIIIILPCPGGTSPCPVSFINCCNDATEVCSGPVSNPPFQCLPLEPEPEPEPTGFNLFDMLLGFDIAENLIKNKILFTLHIIKESIFQTELKLIETSLAQHDCQDQPLSFAISKTDYRYGKLEEIDALIRKLVLVLGRDPEAYNLDGDNIDIAGDLEELAEDLTADDPQTAFNCKYWAYQSLLGRNVNPNDPDCFCLEGCQEPNIQCEDGCKDPDSDINNCGSCGTMCNVPGGFTTCCPGGFCVDPDNDGENCGSCGNSCTEGGNPTCCDGDCVDVVGEDVDNCGSCGNSCSGSNPACCGGNCIENLDDDGENCANADMLKSAVAISINNEMNVAFDIVLLDFILHHL